MSRIILAAGRRFGRYAVFLFVLPAVLLFSLWLALLEDYPGWFLGTAVIMLPLATMAVAFVVAIFLTGIRSSKVVGVDRAEAPGLWAAWEGAAGKGRAKRTTIVIDDRLNASVWAERRLFGILGTHYVLTVGIPLLAATDVSAMSAILAHEDAHLRNQDVNGSLRLAELEKAFDFVFSYASPEGTISGRLLYDALGLLGDSFERETARLSREAELKADRQAALLGQAGETARALMLIGAGDEFLQEAVYEPLRQELMGAVAPPRPPLQRVLEAVGSLSDPEVLNRHALKAWKVPDDERASHPSWAQRLSALGYSELPAIAPVALSAFSLLEESTVRRLTAAFDDAWTNRVANDLQW